jgi:formylglycine-generating enzyme required for sulfatase activity
MVQTSKMREWLTTYFDLDGLGIFCHDYFPDFYRTEFNRSQTSQHNSQRLIEHCERQGLLGFLFGCIMKERHDAIPIEELRQKPISPPPMYYPRSAESEDQEEERVVTRINPLYPITIAEWRNELAQRNKRFGQPGGYWCYVRPGDYAIGGWEPNDPVATITLEGFWIAKYPITVQQYRQFKQEGGYDQKQYWTPNGWAWQQKQKRTQPLLWGEERFNGNSQPVIGVTWYEATAFAKWLTTALANSLPQGACIRLPTEAEWEAAAGYDVNGHRTPYPWGEEKPTRERAVFNDNSKSKPQAPFPVGERPAGAAGCGAQDMVGSVWEPTCSSHAGYPAKSQQVETDFSTSSGDVPWRGGSWWSELDIIRCAVRIRGYPDSDYYDLGFRVVLLP